MLSTQHYILYIDTNKWKDYGVIKYLGVVILWRGLGVDVPDGLSKPVGLGELFNRDLGRILLCTGTFGEFGRTSCTFCRTWFFRTMPDLGTPLCVGDCRTTTPPLDVCGNTPVFRRDDSAFWGDKESSLTMPDLFDIMYTPELRLGTWLGSTLTTPFALATKTCKDGSDD